MAQQLAITDETSMAALNPAATISVRWPVVVVIALMLAGFISPLFCFAAALVAYAVADQDQGTLLAGTGLMHIVLAWTFFGGA